MNPTRLRARMHELNLSISKFAEKADVSESTIKRALAGEHQKESTARMMANALGVELSWLREPDEPEIEHVPAPTVSIPEPIARDSEPGTVFYERMVQYLREKLDASYAANEQIRLQNTELIKANAALIESEKATRARNRDLYKGIIAVAIVAGLFLAGLVAYFVYDICSPAWGIMRY